MTSGSRNLAGSVFGVFFDCTFLDTRYYTGNFFTDGDEWHIFQNATEDGDYTAMRMVMTRNNETGCWIVTFYSYFPNSEENTEALDIAAEIDNEIEKIASSRTFAK